MTYSEKELFGFMDSKRPVLVTSDDGQEFRGPCWAYGAVYNEEEFGIAEPSLEIGNVSVYASEIKSIEFAD